MPEDGIRSIADGKVWTGQQALGLKLIDQIGDFQTAVKETAEAVGIHGKPSLVRYRKPRVNLLDLLFAMFPSICRTGLSCCKPTSASTILWK